MIPALTIHSEPFLAVYFGQNLPLDEGQPSALEPRMFQHFLLGSPRFQQAAVVLLRRVRSRLDR